MTFRQNPNISNNQTSGLHISNAITNGDLVVTGASLTNSQPMHVGVVDDTGTLVSSLGGLTPKSFDYISYTPGTNTDVYTFYRGGSGGTLVTTVTITYTDNTKAVLSTVAST